jgi:Leucine-rich repeat (LRR) protein
LERLVLAQNELDILPYELAQASKLRIIDLTGNKLTIIPPDLATLEELEKIDLSLNPLIAEIDKPAKQGHSKLVDYLKSDKYDELYFR